MVADAGSDADAQSWTKVTTTSRRRGRSTRPAPAPAPASPSSSASRLVDDGNHIHKSPEELASEYHRIRTQWNASEPGARLRKLLAESISRPESVSGSVSESTSVSRAVCLGIGSFDPPDGAWEPKRRAFVQLVAFLVIVDALEQATSTIVDCIFQEPAFSTADRAFITSLGHSVVESPAGFDAIDNDTFVFGVHLYRPIYAKAFANTPSPVIFVGTDIDVWDWVTMEAVDEDLANMKALETSHLKRPFPQDSASTAFTNTCIYIRPDFSLRAETGDEKAATGMSPTETPSNDEDDLSARLKSTTIT